AAPVAAAPAEPPAGVARLQLLSEVVAPEAALPSPAVAPAPATSAPAPSGSEGEGAADAPAVDAAAAATEAAPREPAQLQCYAIGPFSDAGKLDAARRRLQPAVARLSVREAAPAGAARRQW